MSKEAKYQIGEFVLFAHSQGPSKYTGTQYQTGRISYISPDGVFMMVTCITYQDKVITIRIQPQQIISRYGFSRGQTNTT